MPACRGADTHDVLRDDAVDASGAPVGLDWIVLGKPKRGAEREAATLQVAADFPDLERAQVAWGLGWVSVAGVLWLAMRAHGGFLRPGPSAASIASIVSLSTWPLVVRGFGGSWRASKALYVTSVYSLASMYGILLVLGTRDTLLAPLPWDEPTASRWTGWAISTAWLVLMSALPVVGVIAVGPRAFDPRRVRIGHDSDGLNARLSQIREPISPERRPDPDDPSARRAGFPIYTAAGLYGLDPSSFRGQFLVGARDIVGDALLERAYCSQTAAELSAYGDALLAAARSWAAPRGLEHLEKLDIPDDAWAEDSDAARVHAVFAAGRWCRHWGERGCEMKAWY
jgi:hypothetical protein